MVTWAQDSSMHIHVETIEVHLIANNIHTVYIKVTSHLILNKSSMFFLPKYIIVWFLKCKGSLHKYMYFWLHNSITIIIQLR